jgi:hypothetical protein
LGVAMEDSKERPLLPPLEFATSKNGWCCQLRTVTVWVGFKKKIFLLFFPTYSYRYHLDVTIFVQWIAGIHLVAL